MSVIVKLYQKCLPKAVRKKIWKVFLSRVVALNDYLYYRAYSKRMPGLVQQVAKKETVNTAFFVMNVAMWKNGGLDLPLYELPFPLRFNPIVCLYREYASRLNRMLELTYWKKLKMFLRSQNKQRMLRDFIRRITGKS
jgi:hypothetical protein